MSRSFVRSSSRVRNSLRGAAPVRSPSEEEELLGVLAGEQVLAQCRGRRCGSPCRCPSPPAGPVPARIILRTSRGCCCAITWAIMPPMEKPNRSTLIQSRGHAIEGCRRRSPSPRCSSAWTHWRRRHQVVEGDDPMPRGDAVHDSGVPVVQDCGQVGEEDHRNRRARTELTVGELHAAGVDRVRRRGLPCRVRRRVRGYVLRWALHYDHNTIVRS